MMANNEENVDDEEEDIVEDYVLTLADFKRIYNHYMAFDEDGNALDNLGDIPFCLNIVSPLIRDIPDGALNYCRALTDLRVLQGGRRRIILRTIGKCAFRRTRLRRINQFLKEGGVIRLEDGAFEGCNSLEGELRIPCSVVSVGYDCFAECISITSVVFEPSMTTGTVVILRTCAFNECEELSSATLPPTLERIPPFCFGRCTALINMPIPSTVVEVGASAFADCTSLPSMDLPESVDAIGTEAFARCTALTTVTIRTASFDVWMGDDVFSGCTALTTLRMYPWHWGKLVSSMENDANFLNKFFNGTLTPLHQIDLTFFGPRILEAVKDQPSLLYRFLRKFQHQRFETNALRTTKHSER